MDQTAREIKLKTEQLEKKQRKIEQLLNEKMPQSIYTVLKSDGKIKSRKFLNLLL